MDIPRVPGPAHGQPSAAFEGALNQILPLKGDALDLGTGTGRVAYAVAPRVRSVVGIDIDPSMIDAAKHFAPRSNAPNAAFKVADAEKDPWPTAPKGFALITARLFLSVPVLERIPHALSPGGHVVLEALDAAHWHEAGGSRFNLACQDVAARLKKGGLRIRSAIVEETRDAVPSAAAGQTLLKERRLWTRWKADGRWDAWRRTLTRGGTLTTAHLVVWAQRPLDDAL